MRNKLIVLGFCVLPVLLLYSANVHAGSCKDVRGDWSFSVQVVKATLADSSHEFLSSQQGTFQITEQQGCLFYGVQSDRKQLVGAIQGNAFVLRIANGNSIEGTLVSNSTGQVSKMNFVFTNRTGKKIQAGKGTATRQ